MSLDKIKNKIYAIYAILNQVKFWNSDFRDFWNNDFICEIVKFLNYDEKIYFFP